MENQSEHGRIITEYLTYNGLTFPVNVDYETYTEIVTDSNIRESYAKQLYQQIYGNVSQENNSCTPVSDNKSTLQLQNDKDFKWSDKLIRCLLQSRLSKEKEFSRPTCKKIKLWRQIADEMNKTCGINLSGATCDIKYRNLLATYRKNKQKRNSTGESPIKWEYFDVMDEVLGAKASSCPPKQNISDSMELEHDNEVETNISEQENVDFTIDELETTKQSESKEKSIKKKKTGVSFQSYLYTKLKNEEKLERDKKVKEEEKQRKDQERWEEKMKLKEKEIEAILTLAKAIAEKK
ncbi:golgin subfamily A member 6-like protein 22 [Anoplophora glabripennis]|uniref:golgin subfamily A member 6-like protein 22 n=1 Tax=Anoplophora glabripennis TaxID=217634 RepID=UPI0008757BDA|nr:golgin subfamily A member 6-like protein 22 [Anoplophora glabripennis]